METKTATKKAIRLTYTGGSHTINPAYLSTAQRLARRYSEEYGRNAVKLGWTQVPAGFEFDDEEAIAERADS